MIEYGLMVTGMGKCSTVHGFLYMFIWYILESDDAETSEVAREITAR